MDVKLLPVRGEAQLRIAPWKPYLTNNRGIEESDIEVIDGGYRQEFIIQFWIVPPGAKPPTPALKEAEIKFREGKIKIGEFFSDC